jgi:predicted acyltransferase
MATDVSHPVVSKEAVATTSGVEAPSALPAVSPTTERLISLDAFRGFIMFWIVGGEALMVGLQRLGHNPVTNAIVHELTHTPWQGLRFYDCIWPSFMLMVGISVPLSFAKRSHTQTYQQMLLHALKRTVVLILLGSLRESAFLNTPCLVELSSALQPIAVAYFVAVLLVRKSWRVQAAVAAGILAGYALLLALVPAPGIPAGTYELNHNLVHYVDIAILGQARWDSWPYASEGWGTFLSTIPTISTTLLGLLIGELLLSTRSKEDKAKIIGGIGVASFALGYALSPWIPIDMKLWTTSYGLASAGVACLMFLAFFWVIDIRGHRQWPFFFVVIGANAVFIYLFASLIPLSHWVEIFTRAMNSHLPQLEALTRGILVVGVEWLILFWMYRRKIFIKA